MSDEYAKWANRLSVCECGLKFLDVNDNKFCKDCCEEFEKEEIENIKPRRDDGCGCFMATFDEEQGQLGRFTEDELSEFYENKQTAQLENELYESQNK